MSVLREPLLHFLVIGAVLFALFRVVDDAPPSTAEIVVTKGQIDQLATSFRLVWQREATSQELHDLVEDYIREEVLYREAVALGLDRDDTIIRRRMRQKLEFLAEDLSAQLQPGEEDLKTWFEENKNSYRIDERFTFEHVYLNTDRRGENLDDDIAELLRRLSAADGEVDIATLGDPILLPSAFTAMMRSRVEQTFGTSFVTSLEGIAVGSWVGPVESGYGQHLVQVTERLPSAMPDLEEVREAVARDWSVAQEQKTLDAHYQALRQGYTILIETENKPGTGPGTGVRR